MAMRKTFLFFLAVLFPAVLFCSEMPKQNGANVRRSASQVRDSRMPVLTLIKAYERPVITIESPGTQDNKYGFEGGRALKIGKTYHLITTEESGDPRYVKTRLGHWTSQDRIHWKRISTLYQSTANQSGNDIRASLWGPMPVYNPKEERWELFYVGYRTAPENTKYPPDSDPDDRNPYLEIPDATHRNPHIFYNFAGVIVRAVSQTKGMNGIGGPYKAAGIVLKPGPNSQPWEGIQGTDSFFPYLVKDTWYGFYGSCHCETLPVEAWQVGLASAADLAGPWKTLADGNPVPIDVHFVENPVVTQVDDRTYIAVYNGPVGEAFGYATSADGIHWNTGANLMIQPKKGAHWADPVRTPLGLIPEGNNIFTLFYTGFRKGWKGDPFFGASSTAVGFVTLKLEYPGSKQGK